MFVKSIRHRREEEQVSIHALIKDYCRDHDMTQDELAEIVGCTRQSLFNKATGRTQLTLTQANKLAGLLGCTLEEISDMAEKAD